MSPRTPLPIGQGVAERRRRIAELKRLIGAGRYEVAATDVADSMIELVRRKD